MSDNITNIPAPAAIDANEFAVAEKEAATSTDTYTHNFKTPFSYEGKTYTSLVFDWGKLTGQDGLDIENEMQALGKPVVVPTFSGEYLIRMAAKACTTTTTGPDGNPRRLSDEAFRMMPLADFNRIKSRARSFLLKSES